MSESMNEQNAQTPASENQLATIRVHLKRLGRPSEEPSAGMTREDAQSLITALSREYEQQRSERKHRIAARLKQR